MINKTTLLVSAFIFTSCVFADGNGWYEGWTQKELEALKDPLTRNEDISNTEVSVQTTQLSDGNYLYEYTINNPANNMGTILNMALDISCDNPSQQPLGYPTPNNFSEDGKHIIVSSSHPNFPESQPADITASNEASWSVLLKPSQTKKGLILVSAESPVTRQYKLNVLMDTLGWAYHLYSEDEPTLPSADDFMLTGNIPGPGCSGRR